MQPVHIPKIWSNYPVVCIASGASLNDADVAYVYNMRMLDKCRVIVVNNNYLKAPWADLLHFCDKKFFDWHTGNAAFDTLNMPMTTLADEFSDKMKERGVYSLGIGAQAGLDMDGNKLATGQNSGYQAVNLAFLHGCSKVILLGYDCKMTNGKMHWFGNHPVPTDPTAFKEYLKWWQTMPPMLKKYGLDVINCTHETALDMFPRMALEDALK